MGCRGYWNLQVNSLCHQRLIVNLCSHCFLEKWYRRCHPSGRIRPPDDKYTWQEMKQLLESADITEGWEPVPVPNPIHANLDYVYTLDHDAGILIISSWREFEGRLMPTAVQIDFSRLHEASENPIAHALQQPRPILNEGIDCTVEAQIEPPVSRTLDIDFGIPSSMNELQQGFFTDFVFIWRSYIDDPFIWRYRSPVFNSLCFALLRLSAWDFEVSFDFNCDLPVTFASVPRWGYPGAEIFWFHGFLIVLHEDIGTRSAVNAAALRANYFLSDSDLKAQNVRLVLLSLRHVTFVELERDAVIASSKLALLTNHSAMQCSPGFRALARVFTSNCWKASQARRERWQYHVPLEALHMTLYQSKPRDVVAFAQASLVAERCYYSSIPQFKSVNVRGFKQSIPCCGKRDALETNGVQCCKCHSWEHIDCLGLEAVSAIGQYICLVCRSNRHPADLEPGGIRRVSRRQPREGWQVNVRGVAKSFQLRLSKPAHPRPELRLLGNLVSVSPSLIDYTILFSCSYSGLAYGLEDI